MLKNKNLLKYLATMAMFAGVTACGGGGGGSDSAPVVYKETTPGPGSTVVDAESAVSQGTINYSQYKSFNSGMSDKDWTTTPVLATVNFNSATKAGSIQFQILGGTELISTADGYATTAWSGPLTTGRYNFSGNVLIGCNAGAAITTEATQIFVSNSLERIQGGGPTDILDGLSFDVVDCSLMQNGQVGSMKFNTDGSLTMSLATRVLTRNEKINMLTPESFGGALIDGKFIAGNAFRFGKNGVSKYVIVLQTATGNFNSRFRYLLAVQR